jgi:serine/threonine protein kinase
MGGTENGLYALKKVLVQTEEQLELVKHEIHVLTLFNHPNLIPLLDYSIISVKVRICSHFWRHFLLLHLERAD